MTNTFMSSCSVAKKPTPIRQVHTDRCHALMSPHVIEVDAFLQAPVLKEYVEEKRRRKSVKTHATTPGWLLSGLSVCSTLAVMRLRVLFSTKFLERCTDFTRTIARVPFLLNWDVIVILVVLRMVYLLRSSSPTVTNQGTQLLKVTEG